ncbi:MAG: ATP-binding cassette domain-containing protein [Candidatus Pacebacteria bacterium]|nr:ATP-binding cassette domain-containing protein [Candidatus Paceibacterota bacterium]
MDLIRLENITIGVWPRKILDSVSISVKENEKVAICGGDDDMKKVTLLIMSAIFRPTLGKVEINGSNVLLNRSEARKCIGIGEFEGINDFDESSTLYENLHFILRSLKVGGGKEKIVEISSRVRIDNLLDKKYYALDYLERSKASLAAALINDPKLIILSEPTKNLTLKERAIFWKTCYKSIGNKALVFSTRDIVEADKWADRTFNFKGNRLLELTKKR